MLLSLYTRCPFWLFFCKVLKKELQKKLGKRFFPSRELSIGQLTFMWFPAGCRRQHHGIGLPFALPCTSCDPTCVCCKSTKRTQSDFLETISSPECHKQCEGQQGSGPNKQTFFSSKFDYFKWKCRSCAKFANLFLCWPKKHKTLNGRI